MCMKLPDRTTYWTYSHICKRRTNCKPENRSENRRPLCNSIFNRNRKEKYSIRKKTATSEEQISMQCRLNLITKPLNNRLPEIMPSWDLKFSRAESMMQAEDTSHKDERLSTIHRGSTMMSNRLLEAVREPMKQKVGSSIKKLLQYALMLGDKLK